MNLQTWNPFQEFENLLDRYSKSSGGNLSRPFNTDLSFADWAPSVDIEEKTDRYLIKADLPGVARDDIEVKLENGILSIRGEKRSEKTTDQEDGKRHHTERFHGSFARSFTLPDAVRAEEIDASYRDGVLSLTIPKAESEKPKSINIRVD